MELLKEKYFNAGLDSYSDLLGARIGYQKIAPSKFFGNVLNVSTLNYVQIRYPAGSRRRRNVPLLHAGTILVLDHLRLQFRYQIVALKQFSENFAKKNIQTTFATSPEALIGNVCRLGAFLQHRR